MHTLPLRDATSEREKENRKKEIKDGGQDGK
jgi:hypothetical protein